MATLANVYKITFDDSVFPGASAIAELRIGKTVTKLVNPYYIPTLSVGDPDPLDSEAVIAAGDIRLVQYTLRPDLNFELDLGSNIVAFKLPTTTQAIPVGGTVTQEDLPVALIDVLKTMFNLA